MYNRLNYPAPRRRGIGFFALISYLVRLGVLVGLVFLALLAASRLIPNTIPAISPAALRPLDSASVPATASAPNNTTGGVTGTATPSLNKPGGTYINPGINGTPSSSGALPNGTGEQPSQGNSDTSAGPTAAPASNVTAPTVQPDNASAPTQTHETPYLHIIYPSGGYAAQNIDQFSNDISVGLDYVLTKFNFTFPGPNKLTYRLVPDQRLTPLGLGVRGYTDGPHRTMYQLFDGTGDAADRQFIATHEMTHMLAYINIGAPANLFLAEGLAMYGSDEFLARSGSVTIDQFAVAARKEGRLLPLGPLTQATANFEGRLMSRYAYDEAGSFLGYLIPKYGRAKFDKLYVSGNFLQVYGKSLSLLEKEWLAYLDDKIAHDPLPFDSADYIRYVDQVITSYRTLFSIAASNDKVNTEAYFAIDRARLAVEHRDYATADTLLAQANRFLATK